MDVVILAAGEGARMRSARPKALQPLGGRTLLEHVLAAARPLPARAVHVVVGRGAEEVRRAMASAGADRGLVWVPQRERRGTGHAALQALAGIDARSDGPVLILPVDVPLIRTATLERLLEAADARTLSILTAATDDPRGLGRIVRDADGAVRAIVEERDATAEQRWIAEVYAGVMAAPAAGLARWLAAVGDDNAQREHYLTDVVELALADGCAVAALRAGDAAEAAGANDKAQLALLERHYRMNRAEELLEAGVTLRDPARFDARGEVRCGTDVEIDVNVLLEGKVTIGDGVVIGAGCCIKDTAIAAGAVILPGCHIDGAEIGAGSRVGPMARLRPGARLGRNARVGNFVEVKNAELGDGSKAGHLAYLGDAAIGRNVNIGAGTVVCNYDGAEKHRTVIGDDAFVGSNSVLVAPVRLGAGSYVAAGSTVTDDVPADSLAVGRARQRNVADWARRRAKKKEERD